MKCMFEDAGLQSAILFKKETGRGASLSLVPISFGSCFCFFIFFSLTLKQILQKQTLTLNTKR